MGSLDLFFLSLSAKSPGKRRKQVHYLDRKKKISSKKKKFPNGVITVFSLLHEKKER